jgi:hypothetical protein
MNAHFCPVSELTEQSVSWLWPGRLPFGKLAILDGDPGLGKSLVTLDICARLSTGQPFPDGAGAHGVGGAIVLNGEDGDADTIRPRLQAFGADLQRIYVHARARATTGEPLYFPAHTDILDEALTRTGARLVVIDPIMAFLAPNVVNTSDQSVRRALLPLAQLADRHGCAILLIRHLNKRSGGRSLYRGDGSIAFHGVCRASWLIARDPRQPTRCILAQMKNNLAAAQPSLAYTVTPRESGPPSLTWTGASSWTADQLLAAGGLRGGAALERVCDFLTTFLAAGPRTSREIWIAAQEHDFSEMTVKRAKEQMRIRSVPVGAREERRSYWLLRNQELPEALAGQQDEVSRALAELEKQFPANPLEDLF